MDLLLRLIVVVAVGVLLRRLLARPGRLHDEAGPLEEVRGLFTQRVSPARGLALVGCIVGLFAYSAGRSEVLPWLEGVGALVGLGCFGYLAATHE